MRHFYNVLTIVACVACCASVSAQVHTVTFTGRDRTGQYHIPLHHVTVFNLDQLWEEVIYYPDTVLTMGSVGMGDHVFFSGVQIKQNVPNPFDGTTQFVLVLPEENDVSLEIYDLAGKPMVSQQFPSMPTGMHLFRAALASPQTCLLDAVVGNGHSTIKMVNEGYGGENTIVYLGMVSGDGDLAVYLEKSRGSTAFPYSVGDEMRYVGYAMIDGSEWASQVVEQPQQNSEFFAMKFDCSIPAVVTLDPTMVNHNSAKVSGTVVDENNLTVRRCGFCFGTEPNPTLSNNSHVENAGTGSSGQFASTLAQLMSNTTYYVRTFATNAVGTAYGEEVSFTTTPPVLPTVETHNVTEITRYSAICGGNVTDNGGLDVTARGICWSTSQNPTLADNFKSGGAGTGSFSCTMTNLTAMTTYYVRAYATNSLGTEYGAQMSFTTANFDGLPCEGATTVHDYDGNTYNTVRIGDQCWMKENLRTTRYANGASITLGSTFSNTVAYRYYPANNSSNLSTYGYLYNWPAVMNGASSTYAIPSGVQGICPTGWHVPSSGEFQLLISYLSGQSQYICGDDDNNATAKSLAANTTWRSSTNACAVGNDPDSNNATGFGAKAAGESSGQSYNYDHEQAFFWSATNSNLMRIGYDYIQVTLISRAIHYGYSVRCVRD